MAHRQGSLLQGTSRRRARWAALALALTLGMPDAASARSAPARGKAKVIHPLSLIASKDLDFGSIIVNGAGTVVINPTNNGRTATGGVLAAGGTPQAGEYLGYGGPLQLIRVTSTTPTVTLVNQSDPTKTMTVSNVTVADNTAFALGGWRLITAQGLITFRVGGTLNVAAGQADGLYQGNVNLTVTYY